MHLNLKLSKIQQSASLNMFSSKLWLYRAINITTHCCAVNVSHCLQHAHELKIHTLGQNK